MCSLILTLFDFLNDANICLRMRGMGQNMVFLESP